MSDEGGRPRDVYRALYEAQQAYRGIRLSADEVQRLMRDTAMLQVIWTEMEEEEE